MLRSLLCAFSLLLVVSSTSAHAGTPNHAEDWNGAEINWRDARSGIYEASKTGRPVIMVFHATWCSVCKRFREVFKDPGIDPFATSDDLTQLSVGAFIVGLVLDQVLDPLQAAALRPLQSTGALVFGLLALAASTLHLGRPLYAFRAVLGLRHSWLSREIVALGLFAALACCYSAAVFATRHEMRIGFDWLNGLGVAVAISGGVGVFCSAMIYVFTSRECWSFSRVLTRFLLTSALLGVSVVWLSVLLLTVISPSESLDQFLDAHSRQLCSTLILLSLAKILFDLAIFRHLLARRMTSLKRSAVLMLGDLNNVTLARYVTGMLGGLLAPAILLNHFSMTTTTGDSVRLVIITGMIFLACLMGELLERYLFFAACAAPRMPGGAV